MACSVVKGVTGQLNLHAIEILVPDLEEEVEVLDWEEQYLSSQAN